MQTPKIEIPAHWHAASEKDQAGLIEYLRRQNALRSSPRVLPFLPYAQEHHRTNKGAALTFDDWPWLADIYRDPSSSLVIRKAAQVGISEFLIAKAFHLCEQGKSGVYVMPTEKGMYTFVANRVNRIVTLSPHYRAMVHSAEGSDSAVLKHIGAGGLKFVGSNSESSFIEYPADFVIADEYDRCHQDNLLLLYDRLKSTFVAREPMTIEVSTPTLPDYGIDARYKQTDQREWRVACPTCQAEQGIDWFANVVEQVAGQWQLIDSVWREDLARDIAMYCVACGEPWLDERVRVIKGGRYVAQNSEKRQRGYYVSRLLDTHTPIRSLWEGTIGEEGAKRVGFRDVRGDASGLMVFYNSDLGLPYHPQGAGIMREELLACVRQGYYLPPHIGPDEQGGQYRGQVTAGVDVGRRALYVWISWYPGGRRHLAYVGTVPNFEDLASLFARFHVNSAVIDMNPETRKVRELQNSIPYLFACEFQPGDRSKGFELHVDRREQIVKLDRTMICDRLAAVFQTGQIVLPTSAESLLQGEVFKQLQCPIRHEVEKQGQRYFIWKERDSGKDDWFFSAIYDLVAELVDPQPSIRLLGSREDTAPDPWKETSAWEQAGTSGTGFTGTR